MAALRKNTLHQFIKKKKPFKCGICVAKFFYKFSKTLGVCSLKKKATTGLELLAKGTLLTGGSVIKEKLTEISFPSIIAEEVTYNAESRTALIKFESFNIH